MLLDRQPVVPEVLKRGDRRTVLELHLEVGDGPEPELPLQERSRGEEVILDGEAAAVDANLLTAHGPVRDVDVHHRRLAQLVLVKHQLGLVLIVRMELTVEHRCQGPSVVVDQVARHEPALCTRHRRQRLASYAEGREERLRHEADRPRDIQHPTRTSFLCSLLISAAGAEVIAEALSKEGDLEDLELGEIQARVGALELAVADQSERRHGYESLTLSAEKGEAVDVKGKGHRVDLLLRGQVPEFPLTDRHATQRLIRADEKGLAARHLGQLRRRLAVLLEDLDLGGSPGPARVQPVLSARAADAPAEKL
mmetsp:Transcript_8952/g.20502  ORF Transcript_8952/g.20502 Transcript_8952/m.20502 type:complete len:310 (-) Transcript_8952:59-988(-)